MSYRHHIINKSKVLLFALDTLVIYAVFLICSTAIKLSYSHWQDILEQNIYSYLLLSVINIEIYHIAVGLYNERLRCNHKQIAIRVLVSGALGYASCASLYALTPLSKDSSFLFEIIYFMILIGTLISRIVVLNSNKSYITKSNVIVLGAGVRSELINSSMRRKTDRINFNLVGYIKMKGDNSNSTSTTPRIDIDLDDLLHHCLTHDISKLIFAADERRGNFPTNLLIECKHHGIDVIDIIDFIESETGKIAIEFINPSWAVFNYQPIRQNISTLLNRLFNVFLSILIMLTTWPLVLLTVIAIKLEDGLFSPIIYKQQRIGLRGRKFNIYKFRSMQIDAEKNGVQMATKTDSRITKVGKVIRKYRLDELPQLLNVLRGEMSFVGPRPERPEFTESFANSIPYYNQRNDVKPGLTGWAQLKYPYGENLKDAVEKLKFDLYYIKHRSFALDILILVRTSEIVLFGKGQ